MAQDFCGKVKNLSDQLIRNEHLFNNSLREQQEFKQFLKDFLRDYQNIERFQFYEPLLATFLQVLKTDDNTEAENNNDKDHDKFQLIVKQYFADLLQEYEDNYKKFLKEEFPTKIDNLIKQLSVEDLKEMPLFNKTIDKIKSCQSYHCFPTNNHLLLLTLNVNYDVKDKYKKIEMKKCLMYFLMQIYYDSQEILNNDDLKELSSEVRQNFTQDIKIFLRNFESSNDIEVFVKTYDAEMLYFLKKYYNKRNYYYTDKKFSLKDYELLNKILEIFFFKDEQTKYDLAKNIMLKDMVNRVISFAYYLNDKLTNIF